MDNTLLLLANSIKNPLFFYNHVGEILFANNMAIEKFQNSLVGYYINNIIILENNKDFYANKDILNILWLGECYNLIIRKPDNNHQLYQCLLEPVDILKKDDFFESESKYKLLFRHLLVAQDVDRANLARELHDDLGQLLIALKISSFNAYIQKDENISKKILQDNMPLFDQAIRSLRDITKGLHPRFIRELGIRESLNNLVNQISNFTEIKIELDVPSEVFIDNQEIEYSCYRITQEALNNAIKYSQAKKIYVAIQTNEEIFKLVISDNGQGFDINDKVSSLGLLSMQERAQQTGGDFKVNSKIGLGTRVQVVWSMTNE